MAEKRKPKVKEAAPAIPATQPLAYFALKDDMIVMERALIKWIAWTGVGVATTILVGGAFLLAITGNG